MAVIIDGIAQRRTVLTANTEAIISFSSLVRNISLMADGGTVYLKANGTITDNTDLTAIYVKDGCTLEVNKKVTIKEIHAYTTSSNVTLQWVIP